MKVAYVAPEIPGLSSTFVYNEIFALNALGVEVLPFTIHHNMPEPRREALKALKQKAIRLYGRGIKQLFTDSFYCLRKHPSAFLKTLLIAFLDSLKNISHPRVSLGILYRFLVACSLTRELDKTPVDHIHAHFAHFPGDIAMYTGLMLNIPFSITAHANDIFCNYWLLKEKCSRSAFIATISQFNIDYLTSLGCRENKLHIVRCGIDASLAPHEQPNDIVHVPVKLGFLGRLVEKKGLPTLLAACSELLNHKFNFHLDIIGDGPLKQLASKIVRDNNLQENISFYGSLPNDQVLPWLQSLDIFILPCEEDSQGDIDGIPVALMEAMTKGIPVISSRISGIPELVKHGLTGLLSEPGDARGLANNIQTLALQDELRKQLITNAIIHIQNEFNITSNTKKLLELLSQNTMDDKNTI